MNTCKTCKWHNAEGFCEHSKIHESVYPIDSESKADHLIYSYYEGGSFWTGENFGCVHHEEAK